MMTTDPIADMLTRIRNALEARHPKVDVPASRLKNDIARILKDEGYIANYKLTEEGTQKSIRIYLKYTPGNMPVISQIERISRPGCRVYVGSKKVPRVLGGAQGRRGRRSAVPRLVRGVTYVKSRKKADSAPEGRKDHDRRSASGGGAEGQADGSDSARHHRAAGERDAGAGPGRPGQGGPARAHASLGRERR